MEEDQNTDSSEKLTGWKLVLSKLCFIPQRYVLAIMALFAIANAYTMRVCLNLAIIKMVDKVDKGNKTVDPDACPEMSPKELLRTSINKFHWTQATQGLVLSAFYYGYVVSHLPGAMLAERFGGKWVLGLGLLFTAVCTLITPAVVRTSGWPGLFALRVIEGLGEGPTMPGLMAMISRWAPRAERGRFGAIVFGGAQIGNIVGSCLSGLILSKGTWADVFYLFGGLGVVWFLFWTVMCFSTPNTHPYISPEERKFLNENVDALRGKKTLAPIPWKALFRSIPLWALVVAAIGHDWGYFTMVTDLPKYMTDVLRYNIKSAGFYTALPYVAMWLTAFLFGFACDWLVKHGYHTIKTARKIYTTIAAAGPGICIIMASYSGCDHNLAVMWFVLSMALMGAYYTGMKINALDIAPNYAGTITALVNGTAAVAAIITPYLIGLLTPNSTLKQWRVAFYVCLVALVSTNIVYLIFAEGEQQWWDDVRRHGYPDEWQHGPLPGHEEPQAASTGNENKQKETTDQVKTDQVKTD